MSLAVLLTGSVDAEPEDVADWVAEINARKLPEAYAGKRWVYDGGTRDYPAEVGAPLYGAVTGSPGSLRIDGQPLSAPYDIRAVGPTAAMEVALNVAGGFIADVGREGGTAQVTQADEVVVEALVD